MVSLSNVSTTFDVVCFRSSDIWISTCPEIHVISQGASLQQSLDTLLKAVHLSVLELYQGSEYLRQAPDSTLWGYREELISEGIPFKEEEGKSKVLTQVFVNILGNRRLNIPLFERVLVTLAPRNWMVGK